MSAERDGSTRQSPYPSRPEIALRRAEPGRWALVDDHGATILADGAAFVTVER